VGLGYRFERRDLDGDRVVCLAIDLWMRLGTSLAGSGSLCLARLRNDVFLAAPLACGQRGLPVALNFW
jgi:hypothetical protein